MQKKTMIDKGAPIVRRGRSLAWIIELLHFEKTLLHAQKSFHGAAYERGMKRALQIAVSRRSVRFTPDGARIMRRHGQFKNFNDAFAFKAIA